MLESGQEQFIQLFKCPAFYRIHAVRMVAKECTGYQWMGRIGGSRRLFDQMVSENSNAELQALIQCDQQSSVRRVSTNFRLRRKASWQQEQDTAPLPNIPDSSREPRPPLATDTRLVNVGSHTRQDSKRTILSLKQARSVPCPSKIRVQARVQDMFPPNLQECSSMRCGKCKKLYVANSPSKFGCTDRNDSASSLRFQCVRLHAKAESPKPPCISCWMSSMTLDRHWRSSLVETRSVTFQAGVSFAHNNDRVALWKA
jgi:hypothetical protein